MKEINTGFATTTTEINNIMVVALAGEMTDENLENISVSITNEAYQKGVIGAVLNFSMVNSMDTYTFNAFRDISRSLSLMGVTVVWAGLTPDIICVLMDLEVDLEGCCAYSALNLEQGLEWLAGKKNQESGMEIENE